MSDDKGRIYFIGHRDLGVLVVHDGSKGLKVNKISKEVIDAYARKTGVLPEKVFSELAKVLSYMATVVDARKPVDLNNPTEIAAAKAIGEATAHYVLGGVEISSADFCFVTEIPEADFGMGRFSTETGPIKDLLTAFASPAHNNYGPLASSEFDSGSA